MAGDQERCCSLRQFVAVVLLLFSLVPGLTCFSLRGLRRKGQQEELVGEAAGNIRGRILFNGKELNFQSRASSVAAKASGLAHVDSPQSDDTGLLGQTLQLETVQEAAWRRLNPTLSCGQTRMKLKAMGPGAASFQLDMGVFNGIARTLPLIQVPNSCGYSTRQNALGLILVVPYDGCSVVQENGYYVLPMSWMENPVQLACPMSQSSDSSPPATARPTTAETTTTPVATTEAAPAMSLPANPMYPPYIPMYPPISWPYYNMQPMMLPSTTTGEPATTRTSAPTTTAESATTIATPVSTTGAAPVMNPPANPMYPPYLSMYPPAAWSYYNMQPMMLPSTTTGEPATTTAEPATSPVLTTGDAPIVNPPSDLVNQPYFPMYPPFAWPYYNVWPMMPPSTTSAPTTTSEPATTTAEPTTIATSVLSTGSTPAMKPPANPINQPYFPMYPPFAWPYYDVQPMVTPATTTAEPATTPVPTTGITLPIDHVFPYYPNQYPYGWYPFLNLPESNVPPATTATSVTTTSQPPIQYYPPYYQYQPAGILGQSELFYPFLQPLYPQHTNPSTGCSQQSGASVKMASASTPACPNKISSGSSNVDLMSPYNGYNWLPFSRYMWHNEAGKFMYAWNYRSQAGYLPGAMSPVQQYPGFLYQRIPWFSYSSGTDVSL